MSEHSITATEPERGCHVLIVDDDPECRRLLARLVERAGHSTATAASAEDAVRAASREQPDVVLLDVVLPGASGFEVFDTLCGESCGSPQVIFVSGRSDLTDRVHGLDIGAIDFVLRPFEADDLLARVRAASRVKRRIDALAADAVTDPLTGLLNRALLPTRLGAAVAAAERYARPLSVLMLDLDQFKRVNDRLGHVVGDRVLRECARRLRGVCRRADSVFRFGGEEFLVLAPETTPTAARILAERLRVSVAEAPFAVQPRQRQTVSVGLAHWARGVGWQDLVERADGALLRAKRSGRNRVAIAC